MRYLKIDDVVSMTSLSRSTIYRLEKIGDFPKKLNISKQRVAWRDDQVIEWLRSNKSSNN